MQILGKFHWVKGIDPIADAFAGTVETDIVECKGQGVLFFRYDGVGTTGTSVVTAQACSTIGPAATTAVPFIYRISTTADTWGDWTAATTTGFTTTAGSSQMYQVYVDAAHLAETGYGYARAVFTEDEDSPVLGGVLIAVVNIRYGEQPESLID